MIFDSINRLWRSLKSSNKNLKQKTKFFCIGRQFLNKQLFPKQTLTNLWFVIGLSRFVWEIIVGIVWLFLLRKNKSIQNKRSAIIVTLRVTMISQREIIVFWKKTMSARSALIVALCATMIGSLWEPIIVALRATMIGRSPIIVTLRVTMISQREITIVCLRFVWICEDL